MAEKKPPAPAKASYEKPITPTSPSSVKPANPVYPEGSLRQTGVPHRAKRRNKGGAW